MVRTRGRRARKLEERVLGIRRVDARFGNLVVAPVVAGIVVAAHEGGLAGAAIACLSFCAMNALLERNIGWLALMPLTAFLVAVVYPFARSVAVVIMQRVFKIHELDAGGFWVLLLTTTMISLLPRTLTLTGPPRALRRVLAIGTRSSVDALATEVEARCPGDYEFVGRLTADEDDARGGVVRPLGTVDDLEDQVRAHGAHLVLMAERLPLPVSDHVTRSCMDLSVQVCGIADFSERVLGHVPVTDLSATWFRYLMHPSFRSGNPRCKRLIDVLVSTVVGVLALPFLLLAVVIIRRDGGPAIFRQIRIGEGGRPFTLYKLRTMAPQTPAAAQWASADDPRVTGIGRFLRRTHLDELPQLVNVLRGNMSLVGPRPEQPQFVLRLERTLPFYERRHLIKPGITGWAQISCDYAGSDTGSAWKLCHDLFYVKHRSTAFDLMILSETLRMPFRDPYRPPEWRTLTVVPPVAEVPRRTLTVLPPVAEVPREVGSER